MNAIALCAVGAEKVLSNELRKLGLPISSSTYGRVRFSADLGGLYRALMALRTADRVMLEAASFSAPDFDALFDGVRAVPWADLVPRGRRVVVEKVRANRSRLAAETSIQAVAHKAVAERLCAAWGVNRLPDYGEAAELRVYIEKDIASILLDLSGAPLFHRGYRTEGGTAPLRETTAAALVLLMGWKRKFPLLDPFCGAGTIPIEAALYAWDAAPGLGRAFAINDLALGDRSLAAKIREELTAKVNFANQIRIEGSDVDPRSIALAEANAERAYRIARGTVRAAAKTGPRPDDLAALPRFHRQDVTAARPEAAEGYIIADPPYGERLGDVAQAEAVYRSMGMLTDTFPGWRLGVITVHAGFESHFGRQADAVREITNGAFRSYFYTYEPKEGTTDVHSRRAR